MVIKGNKVIRIGLAALTGLAVVTAVPKAVNAIDQETKITVYLAGTSDTEYLEDLADADAAVDFYLVADTKDLDGFDAYSYTPYVDFGEGADLSDYGYLQTLDTTAWDKLSLTAGKAVLAEDSTLDLEKVTVDKFGEGNTVNLHSGLWLAVPHDKANDKAEITDDAVTTKITTDRYEYVYRPQLFTLPTKEAKDGISMSSEDYGDWLTELDVVLKPERKDRFVKIVVQKAVQSYEQTTPATFVFRVAAYADSTKAEKLYENYVGLTVSMNNFSDKAEFTDIPGGSYVVVTEIYKGSSYDVTEGTAEEIEKDLSIATEETGDPLFDFNDSYVPSRKTGYGINNHFEASKTTVDGAEKVNWKYAEQGGNE